MRFCVGRHGAHVGADFALRDAEIALGDRLAVDRGDDLVLGKGRLAADG